MNEPQQDKRIGLRIIALTILIILSFALLYNVYTAYQLPTYIEREVSSRWVYEHDGDFHYIAHITPTSIYDNKSTIGPDEICFSKITDHLDIFFYYSFRSSLPAEVKGDYEIIALVESPGHWKKQFVIVPTTSFNSSGSGRYTEFSCGFPLNLSHYNNIANEIGDEIGIRPADPKLTIETNVRTIAKTDAGYINETFSPSIHIPLKTKDIIEINGDLHQHKTGSIIGKTERIYQQQVIYKRYYSLSALLLSLFVLIAFAYVIFTAKPEREGKSRGKGREVAKIDKEVEVAKKKYGDWIVDTEDIPARADDRVVSLSSLEDLIKIAEELGKPVIHKPSATPEGEHSYHVFDGATRYDYVLTQSGNEIKNGKDNEVA